MVCPECRLSEHRRTHLRCHQGIIAGLSPHPRTEVQYTRLWVTTPILVTISSVILEWDLRITMVPTEVTTDWEAMGMAIHTMGIQ